MIILCGIPIILEAVIGLVTEFDIKADVLVSLALIASVLIREDFAAGEVAFIMQLGGLLEELTVAKARAGIEKLVHLTPQTARVLTEAGEKTIPAEQLSEHPLGKAVVNCYRQEMKRELLSTGQFEMIPGRGVSCEVDTHTILAGNVDMLRENRINFPADVEKQAEEFLNQGCTMIYVEEILNGYSHWINCWYYKKSPQGPFLDTLAHCCLDGSLIIVRYVVLADNLIILQTNGFLHRYDTLIMRIAVTGTIRRISNMNHSDLQILFSNCRHHALCCLACFCVCRVSSLFLRCLRICCIRRRRRTACTQGQRHGSAQ